MRLQKLGIILLGAAIALVVLFVIAGTFLGYINIVNEGQIGILTVGGAFSDILGPGFHMNLLALGADVTVINVSGEPVKFEVAEVALAGGNSDGIDQIVGLVISAIVVKPGMVDVEMEFPPETINGTSTKVTVPKMSQQLWALYNAYYRLNDTFMLQAKDTLSQATRECGGPRTLVQVVAGSQRTELADCIYREWNQRLNPLGIRILSVNITDVNAPPVIQESINRISGLNQQAQEAIAQATLAFVEGQRREEEAQAEIRVTAAAQQGIIAAQATRVSIEQTSVFGQRELAKAQATSTAEALGYEKAQAQIILEITLLQAESASSATLRLAQIYQEYPEYAAVIVYEAYNRSLEGVEKIFYLPAGTSSLALVGNQLLNQNGQPITPMLNLNGLTNSAMDGALATPTVSVPSPTPSSTMVSTPAS